MTWISLAGIYFPLALMKTRDSWSDCFHYTHKMVSFKSRGHVVGFRNGNIAILADVVTHGFSLLICLVLLH